MSLSGISTSSLFSYESQNTQNQNKMQQFQQEFQQLGEDLESGNLSAAQSDFTTLQQMTPQGTSSTSSTSTSPLAQAFQQLGQDLQSGNLSAAQQDYSNIQQDFQNQGQQAHGHHHHRHGGSSNDSEMSEISQAFQQLGQALQSGNLSSAQQAYTTLQQEIQQLGGNGQSTSAEGTAVSGVSVSA